MSREDWEVALSVLAVAATGCSDVLPRHDVEPLSLVQAIHAVTGWDEPRISSALHEVKRRRLGHQDPLS